MTNNRIGRGFVITGIFVAVFTVLVDVLPGTKAGIQAAQILGLEFSAIILFIGAWMMLSRTKDERFNAKKQIHYIMERILNLPVVVWVLIGLIMVYILFFISPLLLRDTLRIGYFTTYLPDKFPIGNDLIAVLDLMKGWFFEGESPYNLQFYPPFTYVFFAPLLLVDNYPALYIWFTLASIAFYILLTLILPLKISGMRHLPLILLLFLSGLVSYGFQFELERGQYNVFTFLLCLFSIYIFHNYRDHRLFAYILFTISVQLKIYPAIFIVMFVDDWRDWQTILRRFVGIGIVNFFLLFILGWGVFLEFFHSVTIQISTPGWGWNGNHSIKAFVGNLAKDGFGIVPRDMLVVLQQNSDQIATSLLVLFLLFFITAIVLSQLKGKRGIDMYLLTTCMIGALTIPISNDYTLSILAAPLALLLSILPDPANVRYKVIHILLILGIAISYSSLLIPFKYKPYYLSNAFPPLILILIFTTILNFIEYKRAKA